jgi:hypothetical protein
MTKNYEETVKAIASELAVELSIITQNVKRAQLMFEQLKGNANIGEEYKVIFGNTYLGVMTAILDQWNKTCKGGDAATDIAIKFINEQLEEAKKLVK